MEIRFFTPFSLMLKLRTKQVGKRLLRCVESPSAFLMNRTTEDSAHKCRQTGSIWPLPFSSAAFLKMIHREESVSKGFTDCRIDRENLFSTDKRLEIKMNILMLCWGMLGKMSQIILWTKKILSYPPSDESMVSFVSCNDSHFSMSSAVFSPHIMCPFNDLLIYMDIKDFLYRKGSSEEI